MITKTFYDDADYEVVMKLLNGVYVSREDMVRVRTRQLFIESKRRSIW